MKKIIEQIKNSRNILILSHKNPDGDAVGSSLALALALKTLGKEVSCFSVSGIPEVFNFLPGVDFFRKGADFMNYDLVVLLDCATFSRTGIEDIQRVAASFDRLIIVDHHPKTEVEESAESEYWIDEKKSSTAVMIYELLIEMGVNISKDVATCLLTGIFTDTGGFQHSNTDESSMRAAAELMKKGPRIEKISRNMFSGKSVPAIKLWGKALSRIENSSNTGMAVSYVTMEDIEEAGAKEEDLSGLISVINTVSDAKFSLLLTEYDKNKIKGSLRSEDYKGMDVSRLARGLGGGGHKLASGFEMEGDIGRSIAKISNMVLRLKDKTNKEG
ncbi:MAG: bifunctional oligoribonuclease/PAP phosphatase NrnA [Candidatus Pacebacteria bacterium]|nr:bifunctional oligoribonuclease/PAP phosphatase NrnA [Candidatus Paceibacterota bacterium]